MATTSAIDASAALQASVGLRPMDANQMLACDVNGSGSLSAIDAVLILQQATGIVTQPPSAGMCNSRWLFAPPATGATAVTAIAPVLNGGNCTHGRIESPGGSDAVVTQDFVAIEIGDCNGDGVVPTPIPTATPTPTPDCANTNQNVQVMFHPDERDALGVLHAGRAHFMDVVPTQTGWGVFWLRDKTENTFRVQDVSTLYYAHVDFNGRLDATPRALVDIHRQDKEPLYLAAWRQDHFGLLIHELVTIDLSVKTTYQYYYDLSVDGVLSARSAPIRTDIGYSGGIGDMVPFGSGFLVGIENVCQGTHQCSFAYKLEDHATAKSRDLNVVEFDGTHSFGPHIATDGTSAVVVSSKDVLSVSGGIVSQFISAPGNTISITTSKPVNPAKGFLAENNQRAAWNGERYATLWREVTSLAPPGNDQWRMRFASFRRTSTTSTLLSDRILEVPGVPSTTLGHSLWFTSNLTASFGDWVAAYARGNANGGDPAGVVQRLANDGSVLLEWVPFSLDDYAFAARAHNVAGFERRVGAVASHRGTNGVEVRFKAIHLDCPIK